MCKINRTKKFLLSVISVVCTITIVFSFRSQIYRWINSSLYKSSPVSTDFYESIGINNNIVCNDKINLVINKRLPIGTYTLKYEDSSGILEEFDDIYTFNIETYGQVIVYDSFIKENSAPLGCTAIGIYSCNGERMGEVELDELNHHLNSQKLYSFAAFSDIHIGADTAQDDFIRALEYVENDSSISFTAICGDLKYGEENNLNTYKSIVEQNSSKPVYAVRGNHELPSALSSNFNISKYTNRELYYAFEHNEDIFIMLGVHKGLQGDFLTDSELEWLQETLQKNNDKRCFLFMHYYPRYGSGDAIGLDCDYKITGKQGKTFYSLLHKYKNVIYFHGHSHEAFQLQEQNNMNNYDDLYGCHSIHIPSLSYSKFYNDNHLYNDFDSSQGYIVDVYEDFIILKGRDFESGKFLPIAHFVLNT